MKTPYSFSVLRYVHDPVTQEFVNIGVAVFAPKVGFLRALCPGHYGRINRMFHRIDGARFRQLARHLQTQIHSLDTRLPSETEAPGKRLEILLSSVLPPDDSSIQFSPAGVGLSRDPEKTLEELFQRYVECYDHEEESGRKTRNEDDVWKVFEAPLQRHHVLDKLVAKKITAPNYSYNFKNAWKNQVWHVYEPVSFDLAYPQSLVEKANTWVGRALSLHQSNEPFAMHVLLGEPRNTDLNDAFVRAQNILNEMPVKKEFVQEHEAEAFAEELEKEIAAHG
jgi:hypothetical protein